MYAASAPARAHMDALLDEALKQTFPASDPVAINIETASDRRRTQSGAERLRPAYRGSRGDDRFRPDGWHAVTPRIITTDVAGLLEFLKIVFDAEGELRSGAPAEVKIGDSIVMVSHGDGVRPAMAAFLYVYVEDADETYRRAVAAGAESIEQPADMPYGDRRATVRDAWANIWQIATCRTG